MKDKMFQPWSVKNRNRKTTCPDMCVISLICVINKRGRHILRKLVKVHSIEALASACGRNTALA